VSALIHCHIKIQRNRRLEISGRPTCGSGNSMHMIARAGNARARRIVIAPGDGTLHCARQVKVVKGAVAYAALRANVRHESEPTSYKYPRT
jgi:diacylglycerol kinase family enzyme